jgi:hypothetical protein
VVQWIDDFVHAVRGRKVQHGVGRYVRGHVSVVRGGSVHGEHGCVCVY